MRDGAGSRVRAAAFVTFETGQVRPLALHARRPHAAGAQYAGRAAGGLRRRRRRHHATSARCRSGSSRSPSRRAPNTEVWVVNHLSDSVSIVDIGATPPRVVRTLLVGDEPRDIVFAGPTDGDGHFTRAFITTARLGQNLPASVPPELTTPGTPRALVYVFDADQSRHRARRHAARRSSSSSATRRAPSPRRPTAHTVYAAVFQSGNQTTTVTEGAVCDGGAARRPRATSTACRCPAVLPTRRCPGGLPAPNANVEGDAGSRGRPDRASTTRAAASGRTSSAATGPTPCASICRIATCSASTRSPTRRTSRPPSRTSAPCCSTWSSTRPTASSTSATPRRATRCASKGPARSAPPCAAHLHEARITVIDGANVTAAPSQQAHRRAAAGLPHHADAGRRQGGEPRHAARHGAGERRHAVRRRVRLEQGRACSTAPRAGERHLRARAPRSHIEVSGGGPSGLALDEANHRLYVLTRFDNAVKVIDTTTRQEIAQHPLHNPEPPQVDRRAALPLRRALHVEQRRGVVRELPRLRRLRQPRLGPRQPRRRREAEPQPARARPAPASPFHPMKGPMTTQTLRGLVAPGPDALARRSHRRDVRRRPGARTTRRSPSRRSTSPSTRCSAATRARSADADMKAFTDFALQIQPPPNPVRSLDNSAHRRAGERPRRSSATARIITDTAAQLRAAATRSNPAHGQFGTLGQTTFDDEPQEFKVPQLKNAYQKIGMFGTPNTALRRHPARRCAVSGRSDPRLRLPARRQHGDGVRFPAGALLHPRRRSAPRSRAVRPRLRHHLRADRRPADHA